MALTILDPKENAPADSNEEPIRTVLEVMEARRQAEQPEKEAEKGGNDQWVEKDEVAREEKERNEKRRSERRREQKRLRKEERRQRAESPDFEGESTTVRVEGGMSVQLEPSSQQQTSWPHPRLVATEAQLRGSNDKEDPHISPLIRRRKGNALQGSIEDPTINERIENEREERRRKLKEKEEKMARARQIIASTDLARRLHDEEVPLANARSEEEEKRRLEDEQRIALASKQMTRKCVLIGYRGHWDENQNLYVGGELIGIVVPITLKYEELKAHIYRIENISCLEFDVVMRVKYKLDFEAPPHYI
ncbi:trichohyalin-like [Benincasa hispida]|uniref:trichohyalin-like n=1 Tax=Benincasa hispida TaxID=102211 RepID=UPI0019019AA6|nr:trichohyalin-like [Benincasa hispida]